MPKLKATFDSALQKLVSKFTGVMLKSIKKQGMFPIEQIRAEVTKAKLGFPKERLIAAIVKELQRHPSVILDTSILSRPVFVANTNTTCLVPVQQTKTPPLLAPIDNVETIALHTRLITNRMIKALSISSRTKFYVEFIPGIGYYKDDFRVQTIVQQLKQDNRFVFQFTDKPYFMRSINFSTDKSTLQAVVEPIVLLPGTCRTTRVTQLKQLEAIVNTLQSSNSNVSHIALDLHGALPGCLVQFAWYNQVLLIDCRDIDLLSLQLCLKPIFQSSITKVVYDLHRIATILSTIAPDGVATLVDLQLLMEMNTALYDTSFLQMLQSIGPVAHPHPKYVEQPDLVTPLNEEAMEATAATVKLLLQAYQESELDFTFYEASQKRLINATAANGSRTLGFDQCNGHRLASYELLCTWRPQSLRVSTSFCIHENISEILALLPGDLASSLTHPTVASGLVDIVLDCGRRPYAWVSGNRHFLLEDDYLVTQETINSIIKKVGGFGSDNRASLEHQLHRICAIRNRTGDIVGLTIRVGRSIDGSASLIADILAAHDKSILFLGEPACGKTTILRDVARQLATKRNVYIIDTSNEIAGNSDIPHPCVGLSRRLMVPSLDQQAAVMIECIQNHTPAVMVIDEIGRPNELEAARICKEGGVRLIASARGNAHELVKNKQLRNLVATTDPSTGLHGQPTFEVLVELHRGQYDVWSVISNPEQAVDAMLTDKAHKVQVRRRLKDSNSFHLDMKSL